MDFFVEHFLPSTSLLMFIALAVCFLAFAPSIIEALVATYLALYAMGSVTLGMMEFTGFGNAWIWIWSIGGIFSAIICLDQKLRNAV